MEDSGKLTTENGNIDPFPELVKKDGAASVSFTLGRSREYGELKVSATVRVTCDQNEATIDKAAKFAFMKALELVDDGWTLLTQRNG